MPRTFKATIALIITLVALCLVTIVNVVQTNSTQETVMKLTQKIRAIEKTNNEISQKLSSGVAIAGSVGNTAGMQPGSDIYEKALDDPNNILKRPTDLVIPENAVYGGTLQKSLGDSPKGFNWVTENSADVAAIQFYVNDSLARRDFNHPDNFVPMLAYKVTANQDNTEYTIYLRKGVYWHIPQVDFSDPKYDWLKEPHEVTAEDFKFTYELYKNPQVEAGASKNYFQDMESVEIIDDYTFKVKWSRPTYSSLETTIGTSAMPKYLFTRNELGEPLEESTLGLKFNNHWAAKYAVGNGPYYMKEYKAGESLILEQNPKYYGKRYPIERISYHIIKDPDAMFLKLKAGELDFAPIPQTRYKSDFLNAGPNSPFKTGKLKEKTVDAFGYRYIAWNADKPLFADKFVRRAMTYALDRQGLIDQVFNGLGTIQTGNFFYRHPGNNPSIKPYPYDLEKAGELLEQAGWVDTDGNGIRDKIIDGQKVEFNFTILAYDNPTYRSAMAVYKEALRKIGVQMTPQVLDWPTLQKRMEEKKFDAFLGGWALAWTVDPYQIWHSSQADIPKGSNYVGFRNKEADQIIEALRITFDNDKRLELMHKFHEIMHEEQPYTFFFAPKAPIAWQSRVENFITNSIRPQYVSFPWYLSDGK